MTEAEDVTVTAEFTEVKRLRTPRSAAIAGILFAAMLATSIVLMRLSIARDPADLATWLAQGSRRTTAVIAINLIPFAGIAFLWFIGVIRDRMGAREDKFFATVFLGSGLLFVAMLFASAAVAIGLIAMFKASPAKAAQEVWSLGYHMTFALLNVFAIRMAAVFMITTSTIALRTSFINRWLAILGLVIALLLLVTSQIIPYINLLMPLWVFLVSIDVLIRNRHEARGLTKQVADS
jgi:hypothetical protein